MIILLKTGLRRRRFVLCTRTIVTDIAAPKKQKQGTKTRYEKPAQSWNVPPHAARALVGF